MQLSFIFFFTHHYIAEVRPEIAAAPESPGEQVIMVLYYIADHNYDGYNEINQSHIHLQL